MSKLYDPWDDASVLAQRLRSPNSRLYIMIGATQWCSRCRELRPQFDLHAQQPLPDETWLWLDLIEHGEFVGDYQPENLPMLVAYQGAQLSACLAIDTAEQAFEQTIARLRMLGHGSEFQRSATTDPGVRDRLLVNDWAVE